LTRFNLIIKQISRGVLCAIPAVLLLSCNKGEPLLNQTPDSHISIEAMNLSGENRLNSTVRLSWYGTDIDGYVTHFEYSTDGVIWFSTFTSDTTFLFNLDAESDTTDVDFYLRAIDDQGAKDETPAYLRIPLKNSAPNIEFIRDKLPQDSSLAVLSFQWNAGDADGNETLRHVWMKINDGDWYEVGLGDRLVSIIATNPADPNIREARVYFNTSDQAAAKTINGLRLNDTNAIYIKAADIAGAESKIDTVRNLYLKATTSNLLVIGTQTPDIQAKYRALLGEVYPQGFDWLDYNRNGGNAMPRFWNPTFRLMLSAYEKLFVFSDQSRMVNPQTGQSGLFPEFIGSSIQQFTDEGGKYLFSMSFPPGAELTDIRGPFPVDSISSSRGQAIVNNDSLIVPLVEGYPNLQCTNLILGLDPFVPTINAEPLYRAQLTPFGGWTGPSTVASRRLRNGKVTQVFFSLELHLLDRQRDKLIQLLDKILNEDFDA